MSGESKIRFLGLFVTENTVNIMFDLSITIQYAI